MVIKKKSTWMFIKYVINNIIVIKLKDRSSFWSLHYFFFTFKTLKLVYGYLFFDDKVHKLFTLFRWHPTIDSIILILTFK
jgi:hypothetical protein